MTGEELQGLSGEALRPVFKELKTQWARGGDQSTASPGPAEEENRATAWEGDEAAAKPSPDFSSPGPCGPVSAPGPEAEPCPQELPQAEENAESKRATACEETSTESGQSTAEKPNGAVFDSLEAPTEEVPPKKSSVLAASSAPGSLCRHVGLLCFSSLLTRIAEQFAHSAGALYKQWVATILLGAVNIEQTKWLDWKDLKRLLGSVVRPPPATSAASSKPWPGMSRLLAR